MRATEIAPGDVLTDCIFESVAEVERLRDDLTALLALPPTDPPTVTRERDRPAYVDEAERRRQDR